MIDLPATADAAAATALAGALVDGGARIVQLRMKGADAARAAGDRARARAVGARARRHASSSTIASTSRSPPVPTACISGRTICRSPPRARSRRPASSSASRRTTKRKRAPPVAGGADYIGFGPCFTTSTKRNPDPVVGLERLARVCAASPVPVVAIGGITLDTVADVVRAGASAAAIIRAVNSAADVTAAARAVTAAFMS